MKDISFEEKVRSVDWTKYLEPEYYDPTKMHFIPERVIKALIRLSRYESFEDDLSSAGLSSEICFAIGNDHRGTYYPAALEAIDLIIEVLETTQFDAARKCAAAILSDLYYFQLESGGNDDQLHDAIEGIIRGKLLPYSDENIANYWM